MNLSKKERWTSFSCRETFQKFSESWQTSSIIKRLSWIVAFQLTMGQDLLWWRERQWLCSRFSRLWIAPTIHFYGISHWRKERFSPRPWVANNSSVDSDTNCMRTWEKKHHLRFFRCLKNERIFLLVRKSKSKPSTKGRVWKPGQRYIKDLIWSNNADEPRDNTTHSLRPHPQRQHPPHHPMSTGSPRSSSSSLRRKERSLASSGSSCCWRPCPRACPRERIEDTSTRARRRHLWQPEARYGPAWGNWLRSCRFWFELTGVSYSKGPWELVGNENGWKWRAPN